MPRRHGKASTPIRTARRTESEDRGRRQVNVTHSLDDIHEYVRSLPEDAVMQQHDPENDVPYASIDDFVETMRLSCRPGGPFVWPGENLKYNQYLAIALHHLPPGKAVMIKNAAVIPEKFLKSKPNRPSDEAGTRGVTEPEGDRQKRPGDEAGTRGVTEPEGGQKDVPMTPVEAAGEQGAPQQSRQQSKKFRKEQMDSGITPFAKNEPAPQPGHQFRYLDDKNTPEWHEEHEIAYHGTYPMLVPRIVSEGLKPSLGAGSDGLHAHYGVVTPGVYVTPSWHCATNYPMLETTGPIKVGNSKRGENHSGATLVAQDGTFPLRAAFRVVVRRDKRLWKRANGNNIQGQYRPEDIHITHIVLYATDPIYVQKSHIENYIQRCHHNWKLH